MNGILFFLIDPDNYKMTLYELTPDKVKEVINYLEKPSNRKDDEGKPKDKVALSVKLSDYITESDMKFEFDFSKK